MRKLVQEEDISDEMPFKSIIGFFQVYFNHHVTFFTPLKTYGMYDFLSNNHIINPQSARNKGSLKRGNKTRQQRSKPLNNHFGDHLVDGVTKANWPEQPNGISSWTFRNEGDKSFIEVRGHSKISKNFLNFSEDSITHNTPIHLEKANM